MAASPPISARVLLAWCFVRLSGSDVPSAQCTAATLQQWSQFRTCIPGPYEFFQVRVAAGCVGNSYFLYPVLLTLTDEDVEALAGLGSSVDWDGDGDLDEIFADGSHARYMERTGKELEELEITDTTLSTRTRVPLQLAPGSNLLGYDWDGDGDADLLIGQANGKIRYIERQLSGNLVERSGRDNPFYMIDVGNDSLPYVTDLDQDGMWDLVVRNGRGEYSGYRNTLAPELVAVDATLNTVPDQQAMAPFVMGWRPEGLQVLLGFQNGSLAHVTLLPVVAGGTISYEVALSDSQWRLKDIHVGAYARPWLVDWDGDGVDDLLVGAADGSIHYYQTPAGDPLGKFEEVPDAANPFADIEKYVHAAPQTFDVDGDGDLDLLTGAKDGRMLVFLQDASGTMESQPRPDLFPAVDAGDSGAWTMVFLVTNVVGPGQPGVLTVNRTESILWNGLVPAGRYWPVASPFRAPVLGNPALTGMSFFDVDSDGDSDALAGWEGGELRLLSRAFCSKPSSCSLKGVCDIHSGQCVCHTGYKASDCSVCAEGFYSNVPDTLPQQWECKACAATGSQDKICSGRGVCDDDAAAWQIQSQLHGASNSSLLYVMGNGSCSCLGPFHGRECQYGQCAAGYEPSYVSEPLTGRNVETCAPCPAGRHKAEEGNYACMECADNLPAYANGTACACPPQTYFSGIFEHNQSRCVPCDEAANNVRCPGGTSPPVALPGYYIISRAAPDVAIHCSVMAPLENGSLASVCRQGSILDADEIKCQPGHAGPLCGGCMALHARNRGGDACVACDVLPANEVLYIFLFTQLALSSSWVIFLTRRAIVSVMNMKTDAILIRILSQWVAVTSVLSVLDLQEIAIFANFLPDNPSHMTSTTWGYLASVIPSITYGLRSIRFFRSQMFVECIKERRMQHRGHRPETQIDTLIAPLRWWSYYPLILSLFLAVEVILLAKVLWPLAVRHFPSLGQEAVMKVLKAHGVPNQEASAAAATFSYDEIIDFMKEPKAIMGDPEKLNQKLGLKVLCQVTAHRVRYQLHMRNKQAEPKDGSTSVQEAYRPSVDQRYDPNTADHFTAEMKRLAHLPEELRGNHLVSIHDVFRNPDGYLLQTELLELTDGHHLQRPQYFNTAGSVASRATRRAQEDLDAAMFTGHFQRDGAVMGLYADLSLRTVFQQSVPFFLIGVYQASELTTERFLQTFHARIVDFPDGTRRFLWMSDTRIELADDLHLEARAWAFRGLLTYIGFLFLLFGSLFLLNKRHKLQTHFALHSFGYFYNGFEPRKYWWELVKRIDVLIVQVVAYTQIVLAGPAKLLLWCLIAMVFLSLHYVHRPYDDRQGNLLDGLEGLGLLTRVQFFMVLQVTVLFSHVPYLPAVLVFGVLLINLYFMVFFLACLFVEIASGFRAGATAADRMPAFVAKWAKPVLNAMSFVSKERDRLEHSVQRFVWKGPGKPIRIVAVHKKGTDRSLYFPRRYFRRFLKSMYSLSSKDQLEAVAAQVGSFLDHMLNTIQCQQISPHTIDFIFTLPLALRRIQRRGYALHDIHRRQALEELYRVYLDAFNKPQYSSCDPFFQFPETLVETASSLNFAERIRLANELRDFDDFGTTTRDLGQALLFLYRLKHHEARWLMLHAFRPLQNEKELRMAAIERSLSIDLPVSGQGGGAPSAFRRQAARSAASLVEEDSDAGSSDAAEGSGGAPSAGIAFPAAEQVQIYRAELQLLRTELYAARKGVRDKEVELERLEEENRLLREATYWVAAMEDDRRHELLQEARQRKLQPAGVQEAPALRSQRPAGSSSSPREAPADWVSALTPLETPGRAKGPSNLVWPGS